MASLYVGEELVLLDRVFNDQVEALAALSGLLLSKGFVRGSYVESVLERERRFPTGLQLEDCGVAIPHTDAEHVIRTAMAVATLKNGVAFRVMAAPEDEVMVSIVFMLAINDHAFQVKALRNLMLVLQDREFLNRVRECQDEGQLAGMLRARMCDGTS